VLRMRLVERKFSAYLRKPVSVRSAMGVITTATAATVVVGGVLIWLVDRREFPDVGVGMWWALQTVTTVGYGDVTPTNVAGRLVGAFIMLESIAFITVVTAVITSSFVTRARQERGKAESPDRELVAVAARLDDIATRLERIESALDGQRKAGPAVSSGGGP